MVEVEVTAAEIRVGESIVLWFITWDASVGAISFFNCGVAITEGVLSATATTIQNEIIQNE